ncbi:MAG TPA: Crp/Fnr family transcriptional regulator [Anaerolineaceae bacterium]|nr:Crp/Fnr family transcriptional regulator [Anaerolineaceae bacterium]
MFRQDLFQLPLFQGLSPEQVQQMLPLLEVCPFQSGQVVFDQGQPAEYLFVLGAGEVRVDHKPYDGPPLTVARIRVGDVFGWSAAMGRSEYTSQAVAVSDCQTFRMRGESLRRLCEYDPETGSLLLERLAAVIAERLRNTYQEILSILTQSIDTCSSGNAEGEK